MISRRKLDTLVERVLKRIEETYETHPAFSRTVPAPELAQTQYPDTPHNPKTIPAARSDAEKQANSELAGKNTRNASAFPPSQKSTKANAIKKALDAQGWTAHHGVGDNELLGSLKSWYDTLDPKDALVSTADELAQRWIDLGN
jgi:hypothetical protein